MKLLKSSGTSTICKDSTCARSSHASVFFFQAEDGIRDGHVTGVQTCALPIYLGLILEKASKKLDIRYPVSDGGRSADFPVRRKLLSHNRAANCVQVRVRTMLRTGN